MFPDKAKLISLLITALVAGLVVMINVDRTIPEWGTTVTPVSEHGWPLIYLVRQAQEVAVPGHIENVNPFRWPWPVVEGEVRTFSSTNLTTDIIVGAAIVVIAYMISHTVMRRWFS